MTFSFDTTYKNLDSSLYSRVTPESITNPEILVRNHGLCADLGLDPAELNATIQQAKTSWKNQSPRHMQATSMGVLPSWATGER